MSLTVIPLWAKTFPRIYDLYSSGTQNHPKNYFEQPNVKAALDQTIPDSYLSQLENILVQMDPSAWDQFKARTKSYIVTQDKWGWPSQLFDRFHEARAYAFLKAQRCSQITFIDEIANQKTPDLRATDTGGTALLEAKRIRESDDENSYFTTPLDQLYARDVIHVLPTQLQIKILDTITKAKAQLLTNQDETITRRILYIAIRLDSNNASEEAATELNQFLSQASSHDIEVVHYLENEFLL